MEEDIKRILDAGAQAPSGSNSQPWKFILRGNQIDVLASPGKDHPVLNYRSRGTWVAHGALLQNILIASRAIGYDLDFSVFPEKSEPNLTLKLFFKKSSPREEPLYKSIYERATNRKPYKTVPLTDAQKSVLLKSDAESSGEIRLIEDREQLKTLGEALSANEVVMFENPILHRLLFQEIVWTREEEENRGAGLYVKTMELKPAQRFALKFFKYWSLMNFLNQKLGAARMIAKENAKVYASVAAMGIIIVKDNDVDFVHAGRLMERLWLQATAMGLSFHIITGVPFLWQRIKAGGTKEFSSEHIQLVRDAYQKIASIAEVKNDKIAAMVFRVGDGGKPTARSVKKEAEILWRDQ